MQQELAYAQQFGIDYWAFVAYPPRDPEFYAQRLYLQEVSRTGSTAVRFCLVMDTNELSVLPQDLQRVVGYFKLKQYQTVLGGRPLLYIFSSSPSWAPYLSSLRQATTAAGLPTPYIVSMGWGTVASQQTLAKQLGADALSQYAFIGYFADGTSYDGKPGTPLPYALDAKEEAQHWASAATAGAAVVPSITAGWDPRPREAGPVTSWVQKFPPGCNASGVAQCWVQDPTMAELTAQTKQMVSWVHANSDPKTGAAQANTVLLSAWNEHDEGHWICPGLQGGTQKLKAIQAGLAQAADAACQ
jgi:hypothetical protein